MSIMCGNCGKTHTSITEVKSCHGSVHTAPEPVQEVIAERRHSPRAAQAGTTTTKTPDWLANPANPKRVKYAHDLINKYPTDALNIELSDVMMNILDEKPISAGDVDKLIAAMQAVRTLVKSGDYKAIQDAVAAETVQPVAKKCSCACGQVSHTVAPAPAPVPQAPKGPTLFDLGQEVPDGYYAVVTDGKTHFYRVSRKTKNGREWVKVQEQASSDLYEMKYLRAVAAMQAIIEAGIPESSMLYANELGQCFTCGRVLTDDESRACGQGPVCRNK